jgi:hypothetical protein
MIGMILIQGGVKMILVDGYDHMIHICRRNHIEKNYRINSITKILKFPYLNLNTCKEVKIFCEVMLLDREIQYLPYTKGIN